MKRKDCTEKEQGTRCPGKLKVVGKNKNDKVYMCIECHTFMSETNIRESK